MNSLWQQYLVTLGVQIDPETGLLTDLGLPQFDPEQTTLLADLSYLGVIRVTGADAANFLQGQTTNDIRKVEAGQGELSGYCSPKGRLLASFYILQREDAYYLIMNRAVLAPTLKRLRMFVLMAKVVMEDVSDELVVAGLAGPTATELLSRIAGPVPTAAYGVSHHADLTAMAIPGPAPRYLLLADAAVMQSVWQALATEVKPATSAAWRLTEIRAAIPMVFPQTVEAFVPQMVNMHAIDGVNFKKGCYPGQEIVARMQYLGKLKRRMYRGRVDATAGVQPGDDIYSASSESGQGAGKVVDAIPSPKGGYELLAVIEISTAEQGDLRLGNMDGPAITLAELPYPLEQAS